MGLFFCGERSGFGASLGREFGDAVASDGRFASCLLGACGGGMAGLAGGWGWAGEGAGGESDGV